MSLILATPGLLRLPAGGDFDPASLFGPTDEGGYFKPSPSVCYTDIARTNNAAVGQNVQGIIDLSGKGRDVGISTVNQILRQAANGEYYIECTGYFNLRTQSEPVGIFQPYTVAIAFRYRSDLDNNNLYRVGDPYGVGYTTDPAANTSYNIFAGSNLAAGTTDLDHHVYVDVYNGASSYIRMDGSLVGTGNAGTNALIPIGESFGMPHYSNIDLYAFFFIDREPSGAELAALETKFASLLPT